MNDHDRSTIAIPASVANVGAPELTVVVPTYCERDNVPPLIDRIKIGLRDVDWEIVFVDDDSPDGTAALIKSIGASDRRIRCIRRMKRRGLSGACIEGMLSSQAAYVAVIDADLQHDERLLPQMLERLRSGEADIAIGTRYQSGDVPGLSSARLTTSRFATWIAVRLLGIRASDPLSGFFMLRRSIVETVAPRLSTQGFKILVDILATSGTRASVVELPYTFQARQHGESKLNGQVVMDFTGLVLAKITDDVIPTRFLSFLLVGAVGVLVHLTFLGLLLSQSGIKFVWAQTGATLAAMTSNFLLNNALTYRDQRLLGLKALLGFAIFSVVCSLGAASNIAIASWFYGHQTSWWLAGLLGSIVSAVWNYAVSNTLVWTALSRRRKSRLDSKPGMDSEAA
jgi:dolichol-phosphate mannosyltransferase